MEHNNIHNVDYLEIFRNSIYGDKIKLILKTIIAVQDFPVEDEEELNEIKMIYEELYPDE